MSNKNRKLTKAKETLQKTIEKHQQDRRIMSRLLVFIALVTAAALAVRLCIIAVNLTTTDIIFCAVMLAIACTGPVLRILRDNKQIRAIEAQIAEKDQQILAWSHRLSEIEK